MPQTIASDIARKSFGALLEKVEQKADFSADEVQELLASCEIGSIVLDKLWHLAEGFLDRGMEGKKLIFLLREFVNVIELGMKTFDAAHERMKVAEVTPDERAKGISLLEVQGQRAVEMRDQLSALLRRLETSPRHISPSSLPGARGDREAEGYIDLQDLTTRLLSGGDA